FIDQATWAAVHARLSSGQSPAAQVRRQPHLFSGLLKCGRCGGSYTVYNRDRLACATSREKGPSVCSNRRLVKRTDIEARVLVGLQTRLLAPEAVSTYVRLYHEARKRIEAEARTNRAPLEKRHGELSRQIDRIIDAVCDGTATTAMKNRLQGMEDERDALTAQLASLDQQDKGRHTVRLHPSAAKVYAENVRRLQEGLSDATASREAMDVIRSLVQRIDITPESDSPGSPVAVDMIGDLARFMTDEPDVGAV
ncbi:MAG: hypothetical protein EBS42_08750, partial [Caulobacteraceae bacterium]|nr:hypothetical protein [Caulobacteraceae bacterium]